ncbi:ABC transporter permease [Phytomonospora sp. NPDC050363]|uniref:ABC transporter permease n=1 Tax=Phytomonospora sp. NPDC050363 TaxID=3155642 RepID=UPI0033CBDC82
MWGSAAAELTKMVRRPANWAMVGVALMLGLTFTYLVPYAGVAGAESGMPNSDRGLSAMLPEQLVGNSVAGLPVFVGGIALVLGVLAVGGEYGWGTWKTMLTQGPSRSSVYAGKLAAIAAACLVLVLSLFVSGAAASALIASAEDQALDWPSAGELLVGVGAGWLIAVMWAALGSLLAIAMRGLALPLGLGMVWMLVVQNLLASLAAPLIDGVAELQKGLPGPNAGSLVSSLGAPGGTPGVSEIVGSGQATLVIAGYLAVFVAAGALLLRRRDVL